ncbi:hypothetical protein Btru_020925 [Bulinus truncatus]|nr:hypothetical protein Btru_020925 [Bulinus truncatus]
MTVKVKSSRFGTRLQVQLAMVAWVKRITEIEFIDFTDPWHMPAANVLEYFELQFGSTVFLSSRLNKYLAADVVHRSSFAPTSMKFSMGYLNKTAVTTEVAAGWIGPSVKRYISDEEMVYLNLSLTITLHGLLSMTGAVSNLINMAIFCKLGLKNSMTVGLFALSFTDFVVTIFQLASCCSYLVSFIYPSCPVDSWMLGGYLFAYVNYVSYLISCWITTMLSVERCFCVVSPFTVRRVFTRERCVIATLVIYSVHIGVHTPIFAYTQFEYTLVDVRDSENSTGNFVLKGKFSEISANWVLLFDIIAGVGLSLLSQAILLVCTVWTVLSLKSSSSIRNISLKVKHRCEGMESQVKMSPREREMSTTILSLAVILTACNTPRFAATAVYHTLQGMTLAAFRNLKVVMWEGSYFFATSLFTSSRILNLDV